MADYRSLAHYAGRIRELSASDGLTLPAFLRGDMSQITAALTRSGVFQSSTTNGNTYLTVIPNGTAVGSAVDLITASSGSDFLIVRFGVGSSTARFNQVPQGTATVKPWEWALNAVPYMTMFASGRTFIGASAADDGINQLQVSGTATVTAPAATANNSQVPTTAWVRANAIKTGTTTIDFGTFPGSNEASVTLTGITAFDATTSQAFARISAEPSGLHTLNDAAYAAAFVAVTTGSYVTGTGFTIYARSTEKLSGTFVVRWTWI